MDGSYKGKTMKPTTNHPTSQCIQHVQSVTQLLSHSVTESINPSLTESLSHSTPQALSHWHTQSLNRSAILQKSLSETEKQVDESYMGKPMKPMTSHPTSKWYVSTLFWLLGEATHQSINHSLNQPLIPGTVAGMAAGSWIHKFYDNISILIYIYTCTY